MNQENQGTAATPSAAETGKVIPLPSHRFSRTESQTQVGSKATTYISTTDLVKRQTQEVSIFFFVIEIRQHIVQVLFRAVANRHPILHLTLRVSILGED